MKSRSAKNKGNRFEQYLVKRMQETVDANAHTTNASGAGIDKQDIRLPAFNLEIEAKNARTFNLMHDWEQMKAQRTTGNKGILAIRHPRKPEFQETLIVIDLEDFIDLLEGQQAERHVSFTAVKSDKWIIQRLVEDAKKVIKLYEQT